MAARHLRANRGRSEVGNRAGGERDVRSSWGKPGGILSDGRQGQALPTGPGAARSDPEDRAGVAQLWKSADRGGVEEARLEGEPEAGTAADAGRQPAVSAEAEVRGDDPLRSWVAGVSEPGPLDDADGSQSALDRRPDLHPAGGGVRV